MEKFQSLADYLGTSPVAPDAAQDAAPRLIDIEDGHAFCLALLGSREFRQFIVNGITLGDLPTPIMLRIIDHAWGKPVERVEVKDTSDALESLTPEQLESRALRLAEMARSIRLAPMPKEPSKDSKKESVH